MPKEPYIVTRQRFGRIEFIRASPMGEGCVDAALMIFINLSINAIILALNILIFLILTAFTGSKGARIASISALALITLFIVLIMGSTSVAQQAAKDQTATAAAEAGDAATQQVNAELTATPQDLGRLDFDRYCAISNAAGGAGQGKSADDWFCNDLRTGSKVHINLAKACQTLYSSIGAVAVQQDQSDPKSWECFSKEPGT